VATQTKFNCFTEDIGREIHQLDSDTLKVMLTNVLPVVGNTVKANITEIAAGNGYTAGGATIGATDYTQTGGQGRLTGSNVTITASGGTIGPFRYAVIYNSTPAAGNLISFVDNGSSITLNSGENFLVDVTTNSPFITVG
jgi:hypothetical protein